MKRKDAEGLLTDAGVTDAGGPAPERSLAQRLDALQRANVVRTQRAQLKRDLKSGRLAIDDLVLDPPACILTAKVFDILLAVPRYGRVKAGKVLHDCRISPSKTIGGLSPRQRDDLATALGGDRRPSPRAITSAAVLEGRRPESASESADEGLMRRLELLLDEARQAGRLAGRVAGEAGAVLDGSAPKPDTAELRAAVTRAIRASQPLDARG